MLCSFRQGTVLAGREKAAQVRVVKVKVVLG